MSVCACAEAKVNTATAATGSKDLRGLFMGLGGVEVRFLGLFGLRKRAGLIKLDALHWRSTSPDFQQARTYFVCSVAYLLAPRVVGFPNWRGRGGNHRARGLPMRGRQHVVGNSWTPINVSHPTSKAPMGGE
jgi:hypothetical protein